MKTEKYFIYKSYELLENVTPLKKYDCGKLCNSKCCKGKANEDGMILFPGEKELFENNPDFTVYFDKKYDLYAVSCNGICNRDERPLACRIFPYMLYCDTTGKITVAPDIRATDTCDIIKFKYSISPDFLRKLRILAIPAQQDEEVMKFLKNLTEQITDFGKLI